MRPTSSVVLIVSLALISCSPMSHGTTDATPHPDQTAVVPDDIQPDDLISDDEQSDDSIVEVDTPVVDDEADLPDADEDADVTNIVTDVEYTALERTTVQWGTSVDDYLVLMAVDGAGTIYVGGTTDGSLPDCVNTGQGDAFVSRVAPDLSLSWTRETGSTDYDYGYALTVADDGLVYVGGNTWGAFAGFENAGQYDRYLAAWQSDGTPAWVQQWGTEEGDGLYGIQAAGDGDLFLLEGDAVAKHATDGTEIWNSGELQPFTGFMGIAVAPDGTVILSGSSGYPATYDRLSHCVVTGLDTDGDTQWTVMLDEGGEYCTASAVSPAGDIYVTGMFDPSDMLLLKLNATGERQWLVRLRTPDDDRGIYLAFDQNGDLYLLGETSRVPPDNPAAVESDLLLVKFTPDGVPVWMSQWGSEGDDGAAGMTFDPQGRLIVAGFTANGIDGNISAGGVDMFLSRIVLPE